MIKKSFFEINCVFCERKLKIIVYFTFIKNMETLKVYPNSEEELNALKLLFEVMKIDFEIEEPSPYNKDFVDKIKRGEKAMREDKGVKIDLDTNPMFVLLDLEKYTESGNFLFRSTDNLNQVCNAPSDKAGIYIIYAITDTTEQLVYLGRSGKVKSNGQLSIRKGGLKDRLVNGKRDKEPRKKFWLREMSDNKIDALKIYWFVTHNSKFVDCPEIVEKKLLKRYYPLWNR